MIYGSIYNYSMVSFTINLEIMSGVVAKFNETFREWYGMQRWDLTPVKTNSSKKCS